MGTAPFTPTTRYACAENESRLAPWAVILRPCRGWPRESSQAATILRASQPVSDCGFQTPAVFEIRNPKSEIRNATFGPSDLFPEEAADGVAGLAGAGAAAQVGGAQPPGPGPPRPTSRRGSDTPHAGWAGLKPVRRVRAAAKGRAGVFPECHPSPLSPAESAAPRQAPVLPGYSDGGMGGSSAASGAGLATGQS